MRKGRRVVAVEALPFGPLRPVVGFAMILCVTLNPCLDKTLTVPAWRPGDNVRGTATSEVVGGKGNNVARALRRLGHVARPVTFLGGAVGQRCLALLATEPDLDPIIISSTAATREIVTVRSPETAATAFFDPDPAISPAEAEQLIARVEAELQTGRVAAMTLSGSSPSRATDHLFSDLVSLGQARQIPVFLDTYGPALDAIWGFWPAVISVNRREAALRLRRDHPGDGEIRSLLHQWSSRGVKLGLVTDGPHGVLAMIAGRFYRATPPRIEPVNPIGSGDSLVAGLVDAHLGQLDPEATLRRAIAAGVANALVWDAGAIEPATVDRLAGEVRVETWSA